MNEMKQWYIAYTRPGQEKKVTENLSRKKIECYCPLNSTTHQPFYRKKLPEILFCSYSFVRICETQIPELRKINGVINLMFWLDKPFIVPDEEINTIREFLNEYKNVTVEKIDVEDRVRFSTNHVSEIKNGRIYSTNNTARALLPTLGYLMSAEERAAAIEMPVPHLLPRLRSIMDKIVG